MSRSKQEREHLAKYRFLVALGARELLPIVGVERSRAGLPLPLPNQCRRVGTPAAHRPRARLELPLRRRHLRGRRSHCISTLTMTQLTTKIAPIPSAPKPIIST